MTQILFDDFEPEGSSLQRKLMLGAAVLLGVALLWFGIQQLTSVHGVPVKPEPTTTINMLPPPPPPPPPPPKPEDKPPPTPTPSPSAVPVPSPSPTPQAPAPMQIDSAAQAGTDAFGLSAGAGGGMGAPASGGTCLGAKCGPGPATSGGFGDGLYGRYLSSELQQRVEREGKVNRQVFSADFAISITSGRVSNVKLVRSSGDDRRDQLLAQVLASVSGLNAPPASLHFPQRITVRGRKSL